jgi:hypothetical protein
MGHYAKVENGIVTQVIVCDSQEWCEKNLGGTWVQTSYNTIGGVHATNGTPLRKNFAGIGYTYDSDRDAFIPLKDFPSWTLNEDTCLWEAPIPMPTDAIYSWNEENQEWVKFSSLAE